MALDQKQAAALAAKAAEEARAKMIAALVVELRDDPAGVGYAEALKTGTPDDARENGHDYARNAVYELYCDRRGESPVSRRDVVPGDAIAPSFEDVVAALKEIGQ